MGFVRSFQKEFNAGLPLGQKAYEWQRGIEAKDAIEKAKLEAEVKKHQTSTEHFFKLMGKEEPVDPNQPTPPVDPNAPPVVEERMSPEEKAMRYSEMTTEHQRAYDRYAKETDPLLSNDYMGIDQKGYYDEKEGKWYATGIRRSGETKGQVEKISVNEFAVPEVDETIVITGVQMLDTNGDGKPDTSYGQKGKKTIVQFWDDKKTITQRQVSDIKDKNGNETPNDVIKHQYMMGDIETKKLALETEYQNFLKKSKDMSPELRDKYLLNINSRMQQLANTVAHKMAKGKAREEISNIIKEGVSVLGDKTGSIPKISSTTFGLTKKQEVEDKYLANDFGSGDEAFRQAQVIQKFIELKYINYLEYDDKQLTQDELGIDNMRLEEEEE